MAEKDPLIPAPWRHHSELEGAPAVAPADAPTTPPAGTNAPPEAPAEG